MQNNQPQQPYQPQQQQYLQPQQSYPAYSQQSSMKSHNRSAPSVTAQSVASTQLSRRTVSRPPPRFRPIMILVFIISIGIALVGLIMTIIAVWPGYTPVGGNPLKIVGPCLLGVGGMAFIIAMINVCWHSNKSQKHMVDRHELWQAQLQQRAR